MTTPLKLFNNSRVIFWQLVLWSAVDLVIVGNYVELSKSDWATWVGSIGTVGALIGTIWLATEQNRRSHNASLTMARINAVALKDRMRETIDAVDNVRIFIKSLSEPLYQTGAVKNAAEAINNIPSWVLNDVFPLVPLPGKTATSLAKLIGRFSFLRHTFLQMNNSRSFDNAISREKSTKLLLDHLKETSSLLNLCSLNLERAEKELDSEG